MLYLYWHKPGRDWLAIVIYPNRAIEKPHAREFALFANAQELKRIYLDDYQQLEEPGYDMLKLIACPADKTAQLAHTLAEQPDKLSKEMLEFIETVLVYKLPNLSREEIRAMLGLDVQLKQTRFYQEVTEEGVLKGESQIISRLLKKRFGPLPTWAQQNLAAANTDQLENWAERILDAKTLAEVFA